MKLTRYLLLAALPLTTPAALGQTSIWHADGASGSTFGHSIANAGDTNLDGLDDIVIGSPSDSFGGLTAGFVQVRSSSGTILWTVYGTSVSGPFGATGDRLGTTVAGVGDINGDGFADVLATAGELDTVTVYSGVNGSVIRTHSGSGDFGLSLAGAGDVDGDSVPDYAIGNPTGLNGSGIDTGSVAMYSGATGAMLFEVYGENGSTSGPFGIIIPGDYFGISLASGADVSGDGINDFAVGAINNDIAGSDAGQVSIFRGNNGSLLSIHFGFFAADHYGRDVALIGDVDGDFKSEVAIGAPGSDLFGGNSGFVDVIFSGGAVIYSQTGPPGANESYGTRVEAAGDLNGDTIPDFLVGAPEAFADPFGAFGGVYMINGLNGQTLAVAQGLIPSDRLGTSLAGGFDLNSDGINEYAASSQDSDFAGTHTGYVDMFASNVALITTVGVGCGPGAQPPTLDMAQAPLLGTSPLTSVANASPSLPGLVIVSPGLSSPFPFAGCTVYTDILNLGSWIYVPFSTDGLGAWSLGLPIPATPALAGGVLTLQAVVFGTPLEFTNGLEIKLGAF